VIILVVEDDQLIQGMVGEALSDGGFEPAIMASGEEAITLLQVNKSKYRGLVTDINLLGRADGWEVARTARDRPNHARYLYDRNARRGMGLQRGS